VQPNKDKASVHVEDFVNFEALHVNFVVSALGIDEVNTTQFFSGQDTLKDKDELIGWVRQQENRARFTLIIKRSSALKNPMLKLV